MVKFRVGGSHKRLRELVEEARRQAQHEAMLSRFPAEAEAIAELSAEIKSVLDPVKEKFQAFLLSLEGKASEDFKANEAIAVMVQEVADTLRVAFACPKPGCRGAASRLRCSLVGNSKTGVFSFCHDQKTHGGSSTVPHLSLTSIPSRRKKAEQPSRKKSDEPAPQES